MRGGRRHLLGAGLASVLAAGSAPRAALGQGLPPLLPPRRNPAAAGAVQDSLVRRAFEIFDVENEERWYDRVDQLDGLTLGCGHWPQAELAPLLRDLDTWDGGRARARLEERLVEFYGQSPRYWRLAPGASAEPTPEAVRAVLARTLDSPAFLARYARNCAKDGRNLCQGSSPSFFREHCSGANDWIGSALGHAMRDEVLVRWQAAYWTKDVIEPARSAAGALGIADEAGVIALASMGSSASSLPRTIQRQAAGGTVTMAPRRGGASQSWSWNAPGGGAPGTQDALRSWRNLVLWQAYCYRSGRVRGRSRAYWTAYLSRDWSVPAMHRERPAERDPRNLDQRQVAWIRA